MSRAFTRNALNTLAVSAVFSKATPSSMAAKYSTVGNTSVECLLRVIDCGMHPQ